MSERILNDLKNIKQGDKNLHQHLKAFVSQLILDRKDLSAFEAASSQHLIHNGVQESVFKVREAYSHLKDYETKHRTLLAVAISSIRSSTPAQRKNRRNQHRSVMCLISNRRLDSSKSSAWASEKRKHIASSNP
jgi:hypothetical protein